MPDPVIIDPMPPVIETPTPEVQPSSPPSLEETLNKVREEEKRKLYPQLEKERAKAKEAETRLSTLEAQLKELNDFKEQAELDKLDEKEKLNRQIQQLQVKVSEKETELELKSRILQEKIRLYEVANYRVEKMKESKLDPDFEDFVVGTTEEEIDLAIQKAKEKEQRFKSKYTPAPSAPQYPQTVQPSSPPTQYPQLQQQEINLSDISRIETQAELDKMKRQLGLK